MPTTQDKVNIWYGANGTETEERLYPEAAAQSFKRGDLVYLVAGLVTAAVAVGSNVAGATKVLGIALKDASGATNTPVPVAIANSNLRWVLPAWASSNPAVNALTANTLVGTACELNRVAAGKWGLDIATPTNAKVVMTAIHPQYPLGEQYGWIEVRFLDAQVDVAQ